MLARYYGPFLVLPHHSTCRAADVRQQADLQQHACINDHWNCDDDTAARSETSKRPKALG
jgi:hypothetical protein